MKIRELHTLNGENQFEEEKYGKLWNASVGNDKSLGFSRRKMRGGKKGGKRGERSGTGTRRKP